ncbi:hypothetical protein KM043_015400 [Ampulex compressa]|nr:hypothetical protein KM043_015400 [Ampulex compressa]
MKCTISCLVGEKGDTLDTTGWVQSGAGSRLAKDLRRRMEGTMTEFEESVSFDIDDPDFAPPSPRVTAQSVLRGMQFTDIAFGVNKRKYVHFLTRKATPKSFLFVGRAIAF